LAVGHRRDIAWPASWRLNESPHVESYETDIDLELVRRRPNSTERKESQMRIREGYEQLDLQKAFLFARQQSSVAQDYFITSPDVWDWRTDIPDLVIGRVGYDNWLVDQAFHLHPRVALVDATKTVAALHQSVEGGSRESWRNPHHRQINYEVAARFAKDHNAGRHYFAHGSISLARYRTCRPDPSSREVAFCNRVTKPTS